MFYICKKHIVMRRKFEELSDNDIVYYVDGLTVYEKTIIDVKPIDDEGLVHFLLDGDECNVLAESTCAIGTYDALFTERSYADKFVSEKLRRMKEELDGKIDKIRMRFLYI